MDAEQDKGEDTRRRPEAVLARDACGGKLFASAARWHDAKGLDYEFFERRGLERSDCLAQAKASRTFG